MKKVLLGNFMEEVGFWVGLKDWKGFSSYNGSFGQRKIPWQSPGGQRVQGIFKKLLGWSVWLKNWNHPGMCRGNGRLGQLMEGLQCQGEMFGSDL